MIEDDGLPSAFTTAHELGECSHSTPSYSTHLSRSCGLTGRLNIKKHNLLTTCIIKSEGLKSELGWDSQQLPGISCMTSRG